MKLLSRRAFLALAALLAWAAPSAGQVIKLGSLAPNGSPWDKSLRQIGADWSVLSSNTIKLKIYPGGIAGDEEDMIRKVRIGQLHAAGITGVGLCRIFPGILALQLPMLIRSDTELNYVLDKMQPDFEKILQEKGFTILVWTKVGWAHFFSKQPVAAPDDLRKQKLFVYGGDADGDQVWKDAGFHPIPLSINDLMSSLQSGMVDAFTSTPLSTASYQWFGLTPYMCGLKWAPLIGGIVIANSMWQKLPANLRPALLESARKTGAAMQAEIDKADDQAIAVMKQHGLTVTPVSPEQEKQWLVASEAGYNSLIGKSFDRESFEKVKKHLAEFRARNAK